MMKLSARIDAFEKLGLVLNAAIDRISENKYSSRDSYGIDIADAVERAYQANGWFISTFTYFSLREIVQMLQRHSLVDWLNHYDAEKLDEESEKTVAIVMPGNLPLVGFHDLLSVLIAGCRVQVKFSQKDAVLPSMIIDLLRAIEPQFASQISITSDRLSDFDAVIATGSSNTKRYFEYYFKSYPSIIRGHKNSCAVLLGDETEDELALMGDDLFLYFGLGCRSVSKLYIPQHFSVQTLFPLFERYNEILYNHHKYMNNYLYQKSILMVNRIPFLDNGFVMMSENNQLSSPISVINYQRYQSVEILAGELKREEESIQCIVSNADLAKGVVGFGCSQKPKLMDYADGVDVVDFVLALKK